MQKMEVLSSIGPNPKVLRMFIAEKGERIPVRNVDILAGQNLLPEFRKVNPYAQLPVLLRDDEEPLSETVAICEYLDETLPGPKLIGATASERAYARMWYRRIDSDILQYMMAGYRASEGFEFFRERTPCFPESADALKASAQAGLARLDDLIAGKPFICGSRITLADLMLYSFLRFFARFGQAAPSDLKNIQKWFLLMDKRPTSKA